jgi:dTMP kinase
MMQTGKRTGRFIVFEGPDGVGKDVQMEILASHIRGLDKYNEVLLAREPTYKAVEIKEALAREKDAFSGGERLAELYVTRDRVPHTSELIAPVLLWGGFVLASRYAMSTLAYQSVQGVKYEKLLELHENGGIITPDLTLLLDVPVEMAAERRGKRAGATEKFEHDIEFQRRLKAEYKAIAKMALRKNSRTRRVCGRVHIVDGKGSIEEVGRRVTNMFDRYYEKWNES